MQIPALPDAFAEKQRSPMPQRWNRCSSICHPCAYFGYLSRTKWQERLPIDEDFLRVFKLGDQTQDDTLAALSRKGLRTIRSEEHLEWPEYELSGHIDAIAKLSDVAVLMQYEHLPIDEKWLSSTDLIAIDVKSMDPNVFGKYSTIEDLLAPLTSPSVYRLFYVGQLSLYASHPSVNASWCCLYCVNRGNHKIQQIWWRTDCELSKREINHAFTSCEKINYAINTHEKDWLLPHEYLATPGIHCGSCAFGHVCERYLLTGKNIETDPELLDLIKTRTSLNESKSMVEKQYNPVNDRLKAIWKKYHSEHGDTEILCGNVLVRIKATRNGQIRPTYTIA